MATLIYILIITGLPMAIISMPVMKYLRDQQKSQGGRVATKTPSHSA
ncbi:MAG: hypothetical protein OWU33_00355 [Firmicutes bacterium]|jgi:hypothetical protein|nr:hypothetical protein [Bacillota bacterium]